jgi:hypothetical protein
VTELTQFLLGVETDRESTDSPVTVGPTSDRLIDQNPNRLFLTLINPSPNDVFIDTTSDVAVDEGFLIPDSNGSITFEIATDGDITTSEFHAIADGGTSDVIVKGEQVTGQIPEVTDGS